MAQRRKFGIAASLTTPFAGDSIDVERLCRHATYSLDRGCDRIVLFGTTGEGASVGLGERRPVLEALKASGVGGNKLAFGITASAVDDALAAARLADEFDIPSLLVTPPHYYKGVSPLAVRDWFIAFLGALPEAGPDVILYNIPQVTGVTIPADIVAALKAQFPERIFGVKDSSGDWASAERLLTRFPDLAILIGDERLLERAVKLGAAGSISGIANFRPDLLNAIMAGAPANAGLGSLVEAILRFPATSAIKALVAHVTGELAWRTVRPPLSSLTETEATSLSAVYDRLLARMVA
jgi:4-hydroxy-tetrahydrodipicolinate synthase